jgi:hypothetical protein
MTKAPNPFRWFDSSPEVIRLVVMMSVRSPLSLRNVEDLLFERGIDLCHETVRLWWNRFGPRFPRFGLPTSPQRGTNAAFEREVVLMSFEIADLDFERSCFHHPCLGAPKEFSPRKFRNVSDHSSKKQRRG